jgi:4-amino-4-deoxy-L-arabinose transferase-like glycosyltransferase
LKGAPPPHTAPGPLLAWPGRHRLLLALLALALLRGLVYLALLPPWQHYDEPTHFEYVRLIAERKTLPQPGDYDLTMRYEIAASMQANNFWRGAPPALAFWSDTPPAIGLSELEHPPLYYTLLALPQMLMAHQSVEAQLYAARLGSILLYLLTVAAAYGLTAELFPRRRGLPLAVAALVALLPPFTDLGSSVNNDVGVAAVTTWLLWSSVRLLRRGPTPARVGATLSLAIAGLLVKSTSGAIAVTILVPVAGSLLAARISPDGSRRRWLWASLLLLVPILLVATVAWNSQAACWYGGPSAAPRSLAKAGESPEAVLGSRVLVLARDGVSHPQNVTQELQREAGLDLAGQEVTFGAWLQSNQGEGGRVGLGIYDGAKYQWHSVRATTEWQFYAFTTVIQPEAQGVSVQIRLPDMEDGARSLYVDGIVLAQGEMPRDPPPAFEDQNAQKGAWAGQAFVNLLRNGSAERTWPSLRPWIGSKEIYRQPLARIFHSAWDWQRTGWVYGNELQRLFQTFWGVFSWGHLSLPGGYFYLLAAITILALVGVVTGVAREIRSPASQGWQRRSWAVLTLALLLTWGGIVLRIHPVLIADGHLYWPVARYASGVIAPVALLLCLGLANLVPRRWRGMAAYAGLLGLVAVETVALWTVIVPFYYG